jgi:hypothetical protein
MDSCHCYLLLSNLVLELTNGYLVSIECVDIDFELHGKY